MATKRRSKKIIIAEKKDLNVDNKLHIQAIAGKIKNLHIFKITKMAKTKRAMNKAKMKTGHRRNMKQINKEIIKQIKDKK
jgi:hypothetical protein